MKHQIDHGTAERAALSSGAKGNQKVSQNKRELRQCAPELSSLLFPTGSRAVQTALKELALVFGFFFRVAVGRKRKEEEESWRRSEPNRAAQREKLPIQTADHRGAITNTYNYWISTSVQVVLAMCCLAGHVKSPS